MLEGIEANAFRAGSAVSGRGGGQGRGEREVMAKSSRYISRLGLWSALATTSLFVSSTAGQVTGDRSTSAAMECQSKSPTGVAYDELISIKVHDTLFRVPAAYFQAWPPLDMVGRTHVRDGLHFMFWVPELRPVLVKTVPPLITPRPREPGRKPAGPDEFAVVVNFLQFIAIDDPGYVSPAKRFENHARASGGGGETDEFTRVHGLEAYRLARERLPFRYYRHIPGSDPQAHLSCDIQPERWPNPQCRGDFYFQSDSLAFVSWFSQYELPRWREIAFGARQLALRWRVEHADSGK